MKTVEKKNISSWTFDIMKSWKLWIKSKMTVNTFVLHESLSPLILRSSKWDDENGRKRDIIIKSNLCLWYDELL